MITDATFFEMLLIVVIACGSALILLGIYVALTLRWQRWKQKRNTAGEDPLTFYQAGWDCCVDGRPIARLTWAGPPEDLNHFFVPYDVSIVPGCEREVEALLYRFNDRKPEEPKITFRSLDPAIEDVCDSQALVGYLGGNRIELKIYPA